MIILALYVCRLQLFRNAQESAVGKLFPVYIIPWGRIRERTEIGTTWLRSDKLEFQPFHILSTDGRTIYYVESFHVCMGKKRRR